MHGWFWRWFDRGARVDFAGNLLSLIFDWRPYAAGFVGWLVSFFGLPAVSLWSPAFIWVASLACGAFVSIIYIGLRLNAVQIEKTWPHQTQREPRLVPDRLSIARALDNLYAEGVDHRNKLIPAFENFDREQELIKLVNWSDRVLAKSDDQYVAMREKSAFRTLNLFTPSFHAVAEKSAAQEHLEAMWTEKLEHLKIIIGKVGS